MLTRSGRCVVSACVALDALDHDWPWRTAAVRKAKLQADECAAVMRRHSFVSFSLVLITGSI